MGKTCVWVPTVKNKQGKEVKSELFLGLTSKYQNREAVKTLWAMSKVPSITDNWVDIEYDNNGEITVGTIERNVNVYDYVNNTPINLDNIKKSLKATDENGNIIYHSDYTNIIDNVIGFNNSQNEATATIEQLGNRFYIKVEKRTAANFGNAKKTEEAYTLNTKLMLLIRSLGFDILIDPRLQQHGIFNPTDGTITSSGLKTIIRIAQGKEGQEALPEEFSHVFVTGLKNKPIMQRLLNLLANEEIVKEVLGDQYDQYYNEYEGNLETLKEEAAAKILAEYIKENNTNGFSSTLLRRVWDFTKNLLAKGDTETVDMLIRQVQEDMYNLSSNLEEYKTMVDLKNVVNSRALYQLNKEIHKTEQLALEGKKLLLRRIQLLKTRKKGIDLNHDFKALRELEDKIKNKEFAIACIQVAKIASETASNLLKRFNTASEEFKKEQGLSDARVSMHNIAKFSSIIREFQEFDGGFRELLTSISMIKDDDSSIISASDNAKNALHFLNEMRVEFKELRFNLVKEFLLPYFGKEKNLTLSEAKDKAMTLDYILRVMNSDLGLMQRWITSMSTSTDPALALVDHVFKYHQHLRDTKLIEFQSRLRAAHKKLEEAGYDTSFMIELDSNGVPTGRLISDIDYERYLADKAAYIKELNNSIIRIPSSDKYRLIKDWNKEHLEKANPLNVVTEEESDDNVEFIPKKSLYFKDTISKLAPAQREYYEFIMHEKRLLEQLLPKSNRSMHRAIFTRNDVLEGIGSKSPKELIRLGFENTKDKFIRREDDTDFGDIEFLDPQENLGRNLLRDEAGVRLDLSGKPVKSVPIFYTRPLEDMSRLSTDMTSSMLAYAAMAMNYAEFSRITDVLELTKDVLGERNWEQKRGDAVLVEVFKEAKDTIKGTYNKKGLETAAYARINDYYESNLYGRRKLDEGSLGKYDRAKILDAIKNYTGKVGLGFNPFSAISNVLVGKIQSWIIASNGEYTFKDMVRAEALYRQYKLGYLSEVGSFNKSNKMSLLVEKFNILDEFWQEVRNKGVYNNGATRLAGQFNHMILNSIGEHDLHCTVALAILNNTKVKRGNETISLEEALIVKEGPKGVFTLQLDEGVTKENGEKFTEKDLFKIKQKIRKTNQLMYGAFDETDRGAINRFALGRLAMQFRQWMPMHYLRRFGEARWDFDLDQEIEGYYRTAFKFVKQLAKEALEMKFDIVSNWNNLTSYQKQNISKSLRESALFLILSFAVKAMGSAADDKGKYWKRMLHLQMRRLKMEVGASVPINVRNFMSNILNTLSSPAACINSIEDIFRLVTFAGINQEVDRGRYKGMTVWERDAMRTIPYFNQVLRTIDLSSEDYMFSIYND